MRGKTFAMRWLTLVWLALTPGIVYSQGYAPPDPILPVPLGSTRPEDGGLFFSGQYVMYRQTNPIGGQLLAVRGFIAVDDTVLGVGTAGQHVGSRSPALDVAQVGGPNGHQPGFIVELGYQFEDGTSLSVDWMHLTTNDTRAAATLTPPNLRVGSNFADSYITALVYNFPNDYAGPLQDIGGPFAGPGSGYSVWNAAEIMVIQFEQRAQQVQATYRVPVIEEECYRLSGLVGPRFFWIWERFKWRTEDRDVFGNLAAPTDVAIYTNIASNRMYGVHLGCRQEWYLGGSDRLGGFVCQLDLEGALFLNSVKQRAKYELGTKLAGPAFKRSRRVFTFVPEIECKASLVWLPAEAIQVFIGYDVFAFFNTKGSPEPVDFNFGATDPEFEKVNRLFDGIRAGVRINF